MNAKENTERKQGCREALIETAMRLFAERGFDGVSTRDLTEGADVNLGSIQYHFGSKAQLFIETVQALMAESGVSEAREQLATGVTSREEAAARLCEFIQGYLSYLLCPVGPQACRIMYRESLTPLSREPEIFGALVQAVVRDYLRPLEDTLVAVLKKINGSLSELELRQSGRSILGQSSYYLTHRPFVEEIDQSDLSRTENFDDIVRHVCSFSLRALDCNDNFIESTLKKLPRLDPAGEQCRGVSPLR